jgi:hypothetical protein
MPQINTPVNPNVPDAYIFSITPTSPIVGDIQTDLISVEVRHGHAGRGRLPGRRPQPARRAGQRRHRRRGQHRRADQLHHLHLEIHRLGANADTVTIIAAGSAASSYKATVQRPGLHARGVRQHHRRRQCPVGRNGGGHQHRPERLRGPSEYIVASAGVGVTAPSLATYTLTGGTDGVTTITAAVLLGVDTGTRTGMYALRGSGPGSWCWPIATPPRAGRRRSASRCSRASTRS